MNLIDFNKQIYNWWGETKKRLTSLSTISQTFSHSGIQIYEVKEIGSQSHYLMKQIHTYNWVLKNIRGGQDQPLKLSFFFGERMYVPFV